MREPLKVFISYSRKDEALKDMLLENLRVLERFQVVKVWTDAAIAPGADWREEIDRAIATADVALLLLSTAFLASDFIQTTELPELLKKEGRKGLVVIPVILRECSWEVHSAIKPFQVLPRGREPIAKHTGHKRDVVLKQVANEIAELANDRSKRSHNALPQPETAPAPFTLRFVTSPEEIRATVSAFHQEARSAPDRARSLLRQTTYWVHDLETGNFGPAKFVGYTGMSLDRYADAHAGRLTGDRFDGHLTRNAIEDVLEHNFAPNLKHADHLVRWCEALFGKGAFGNADRSKWLFVTIGSDTGRGDDKIVQAYRMLRDARGKRPTASEVFLHVHSSLAQSAAHRGWFDFVGLERDLSEPEQRVLRVSGEWLRDLEATKMSKCFKMIALEALIEADALNVGFAVEDLSRRSHAILLRSPDLLLDLPEPFRVVEIAPAGSRPRSLSLQRFTAYWKKNPIAAWTTGTNRRWFEMDGERLVSRIPCPRGQEAVLGAMTRELIDYQLARYRARSAEDSPSVAFAAKVTGHQGESVLKLTPPERSKDRTPTPGDDATYRTLGSDRTSSRSLPTGAHDRAKALMDEIVHRHGVGAVLERSGRRLRIVGRTDGGGLRIDGGPGGFARRTISPTDIAWVLLAEDDVTRNGGHLDERRVNRLRYIDGTPRGSTRWIDTRWAIFLVSELGHGG